LVIFVPSTIKESETIVKQQLLTKVLGATAIALSSLTVDAQLSHAVPGVGESGFWCSTSTGKPVTVYQNRQGAIEPWIEWASDYFSASGYDPITRCQLVSQRLEIYRRNRQLKYIAVGQMNGQNVICTANQVNGVCQNLIYTLRRDQDPIGALYNLLAWRQGQVGMPSLDESGKIPYIDVREKLGENLENRAEAPLFFPSP
jgi:Circadian oscillating protein COP23